MLLLDMAEYSFNGGDFYSEEELLRLDNNVRQELGIPIRRKEVVQAYLLEPETYQNFLRLRFRIASELPLFRSQARPGRTRSCRDLPQR